MRGPFKSESDPIEVALRRNRVEPGVEFVAQLTARVSAADRTQSRGSSRFAFSAALAVLVVGTFLSFGGAAYAASGEVTAAQKPAASAAKSAAADEYGSQDVAQAPVATPKDPPTSAVAGVSTTAPAATSGNLPFTGIGLGSTLLVSLLLVSLGVYLRRRESLE